MKKIALEFILEEIKKEKYQLAQNQKYQNAKTKLNFICGNGHEFMMSWDKWKKGQRCGKCCSKKNDLQEIKKSLEQENFQLKEIVQKEKTTYFYICPQGHERKLNFSNWKLGHRCLICSNCFKKNYNAVYDSFKNENYILLEKEYLNAKTKMKYKCPNSHINYMSWNKWSQGRRCPDCMKIKISINKKLDYSFVKHQFEKENYLLKSKQYRSAKQKLFFQCPYKHKHYITYDKWKRGQRCKTCQISTKISKGEQLIKDKLKNFSYLREYKIADCKNIKPLPFDFAIFDSCKNLKALIEFNGEQHYRPIRKFGGKKAYQQQVNRDKIKIDYCNKNSIPLLVIKFDQTNSLDKIIDDFLKTLF